MKYKKNSKELRGRKKSKAHKKLTEKRVRAESKEQSTPHEN